MQVKSLKSPQEEEIEHAPSTGKTAVQPAQRSIICNYHVSGSEMWLFTE
jgi:hypothetical protein